MRPIAHFLLPLVLTLATPLPALEFSPLTNESGEQLVIHNRILAKANGKTLSVLDVVKKMDVYLNQYYPELTQSPVSRYQFYTAQWKATLNQMIDNELILADAEEKELKVTDAEVREQMIERFGPNIMANLDKLGITYEEARQMVYTDMAVERMTWYRVNNKAIQGVNPQDIKAAYKEFCISHPSQAEWKYQVLSIRSPNSQAGEEIACKACLLLQEKKGELASLPDQLREQVSTDENTAITVSQELVFGDKNLSKAHRTALENLPIGSYSPPIAQVSRVDNQTVYRIFHLKERVKKEIPTFEAVADELHNNLVQKAVVADTTQYKAKLRQRYGFGEKQLQEMIPSDFQPFSLLR